MSTASVHSPVRRFRLRVPATPGRPVRHCVVLARHARHAQARLLAAPDEIVFAEPLGPPLPWARPRRPPGSARRDLYQHLVTCLGVEPDLVAALRTCLGLVPHDGLNLALAAVVDALEDGTPLDTALGALAAVIPPDHLAQWRAGAAAGQLVPVLRRLAADADREQAGFRRLRQALAYPLIVLVAALITGWQAAGQQAPVVAGMFTALGAEPPRATRLLLELHAGVRQSPWLVLGVGLGAIAVVRQLPGAWQRGGAVTRLVEFFPPLRRVLFRLALARSLNPLALLLRAGVPLPDALGHAAQAAGHPRLRPFWEMLRTDLLQAGRTPVAAALAAAPLLGNEGDRLLALLRLGEQTGDFASLAERLARVSAEEAEEALGTVQALATPVALGLVGLVIALLVLATVVPLSRLATVVLPGGTITD